MSKLEQELDSFKDLWHGGTNLAKRGWEASVQSSVHQDLHGIYNICVRPYVNEDTTILEIGCGGGGWTHRMVHAKRVIGFDALSAEHNKFWDRIGERDNVEYYQVKDFECSELEDDSIDHVFSYDVFCHISFSGAYAYAKNLYPKMKKGAQGFIMIADADKYFDQNGLNRLARWAGFSNIQTFINDYDGPPYRGRWYFYGTKRFCDVLEDCGYTIKSQDVAVEVDKLNPIVWFKK